MIRRLGKTKKEKRSYLLTLFITPIILSLVGLFFVFEASSVKSFSEFGDSFHYLKLQFVWIVLGIAMLSFFATVNYHRLYYISFFFMTVTITLLLLVLVPGVGHRAGGAQRWLDLGIINFQPTELAKLSVIVYLSSWFIHRERKRFFSFIILLGGLMFLIVLQPDMGTAIIVFLLSIIIYYLAGIELHYLLFLIPVSFISFLALVKISPYRFHRLLAFFNPALDPQGITYHITQILISLGNGGLLGQGFGISRQKYLFLPEAHTDSIFAIVSEEFGFVGNLILISAFIYLLSKMYRAVNHTPDRFGRLLAGGIFAFFNLQILINLSGMVNLLPLTGVPLPFISYGGSNLLVSFILLGILINIGRQSKV
ncbi:FtsW/RodA/SpoVE family cell cycle protein [Candidatus Roizmanbacteria bacterium]|nr:FtsW/RodA/SpoVE family cell cycle protein [Candidatus Roizmanbacteria bacterium]